MEKEKKSQDKDTKKKNLLDDTLKQIEKQFGKNIVRRDITQQIRKMNGFPMCCFFQ